MMRRISPFARRLSLIVLLAVLGRFVYVQFEVHYLILTDEAWYITMAHRLFGAHPWSNVFNFNLPTAQHGPLTSLVVAPFAWLFPQATEGLRYVMCCVGGATVLMCGLVGRRLGGNRTGLAVALVAAVFPDFWIRDGLVVAEPLAILIVVTCVYLAFGWTTKIAWPSVIAYGVLIGLETLTRPEIVPVLVVIAVFSLRKNGLVRALGRVAVVLVVGTLIVAPWTAYNSSRFHNTVVVSNNLGSTLMGANCPASYYSNSLIGYDALSCTQSAVTKAEMTTSDESVISSRLTSQAIAFALHHPARLAVVVVYRELWFLGLYRPGYVATLGALGGQPVWATWVQAVSMWICLPLALIGWWRLRKKIASNSILAMLAINSFVVAGIFVGHWRYRITLDVAVVLVLGLMIDYLRTTRKNEHELTETTLTT